MHPRISRPKPIDASQKKVREQLLLIAGPMRPVILKVRSSFPTAIHVLRRPIQLRTTAVCRAASQPRDFRENSRRRRGFLLNPPGRRRPTDRCNPPTDEAGSWPWPQPLPPGRCLVVPRRPQCIAMPRSHNHAKLAMSTPSRGKGTPSSTEPRLSPLRSHGRIWWQEGKLS